MMNDILLYVFYGMLLGLMVIAVIENNRKYLISKKYFDRTQTLIREKNTLKQRLCKLINHTSSPKTEAEQLIIKNALLKNTYSLNDINNFLKILHHHYQTISESSGIKFKKNCVENTEVIFSPLNYYNVLTIINEAVFNVIIHSRASFCFNIITLENGNVHIITHDDGIGFNYDKTLSKIPLDKGLHQIKKRSLNMGMELKVSSINNVGTKLSLILTKRDYNTCFSS